MSGSDGLWARRDADYLPHMFRYSGKKFKHTSVIVQPADCRWNYQKGIIRRGIQPRSRESLKTSKTNLTPAHTRSLSPVQLLTNHHNTAGLLQLIICVRRGELPVRSAHKRQFPVVTRGAFRYSRGKFTNRDVKWLGKGMNRAWSTYHYVIKRCYKYCSKFWILPSTFLYWYSYSLDSYSFW